MARERMSGGTAVVAVSYDNGRGVDIASVSQKRGASSAKKKMIGRRGVGDATTRGSVESGSSNSPHLVLSNSRKSSLTASSTISSSTKYTINKSNGGCGSIRAVKTLGWFLNDDLFQRNSGDTHSKEKETALSSSSSSSSLSQATAGCTTAGGITMSPTEVHKSRSNTLNRNSLPPQQQQNSNSIGTTPTRIIHSDDRKKRRFRQRFSKKVSSANESNNTGHRTAETSSSGEVQQQHEASAVDGKVTKASNDFKDAYWYYDPITDGFYYDSRGSRGWRRRNPALERRQVQDKEGLSCVWVDPNLVHYSGADPFGYHQCSNNNYFSPHIQYYDPETDGYYFEMPSVDGWKKRQPHSSFDTFVPSVSEYPNNNTMSVNLTMSSSLINTDTIDAPRTLCGFPLAQGQLTSCTVTATSVVTSVTRDVNPTLKDTFSSTESSFSTLSSVDEFTGTSPLEKGSKGGNTVLSCKIHKPLSYADVVATSSDRNATVIAEDVGSSLSPQQIISTHYKRPGTLELHIFSEQTDPIVALTNEEDRKRPELTNFNADKFIADLPFVSTERVLRDLAALKTPCSVQPVCNMDSPRTPVVMKGLYSPLGISNHQDIEAYNALCDVELMLNQILSHTDEKVWEPEVPGSAAGTSKLNFWRNSGLVAGVAGMSCDNM